MAKRTRKKLPVFNRPFRAKPIEVDGHKFPSKAEAARYGILNLRRLAGEIRVLKVHPRLPLVVNGTKIGRGWIELDFQYEEWIDGAWRKVYEDAKGGADTREARIRRQVCEACNGIKIRVIRSDGR